MTPVQIIAVVSSASFLVFAFPRFYLYPLAFIALVPILWVTQTSFCSRRRAFFLGWLTGFLFHLGTLWWLARLYATEIEYPILRIPGLIALAGYQGLFYAAAFWGWNALCSRAWWIWPGIWVLTEYTRSISSLAFPWTILANSLAAEPFFLQPAAFGGIWLLDFGLASTAVAITGLVNAKRSVLPPAILLSGIVVLWGMSGLWGISDMEPTEYVALVQPNALPEFKWQPGGRGRVYADLKKLSVEAVESFPETETLIVWPETALPTIIRPGGGVEFWLSRLVDRMGVPLITGALGMGEEHGESLYTNAAYLVLPDSGIVSRYDKLHLVPFSEKMPFSRQFRFLKELNLGQGDYAHGDSVTIFNFRNIRAGVLICFEAILPSLVRKHIKAGAEVLVNITNDSWFGDTGAPEQHAAMAVIRAVEYRRWLIRAANSGISLIADPWGRVTQRSDLFKQEYLIGRYGVRNDVTVYARYGDWIVWLSTVLCIYVFISRYWNRCVSHGS